MKDIITLIDSILDTYDRSDFHPNPDGSTHCNQAVNAVALAMGYNGFAGLNADQIVSLMAASADWTAVPIEQAQDLANQGSLVVAGMTAQQLRDNGSTTLHGHVVTVRPGKCVFSGKWDKTSPGKTPRVLNIGASDFIARGQSGAMTNQSVGLNEAFIPMPKLWVLRTTL